MIAAPTLADTRPLTTTVRVESVQSSPFSLRLRLKLSGWALVRATVFRWSPAPLRGLRRWLLRLFGARLAPTASIHNAARIDFPWNLEMGHCASLGEDTWAYALDKIVLGDYACVGQRTVLLTGSHDFSDPTFPLLTQPIVIGYGSWIAVGVTVLPGVKIGALTVVGAGSVVVKDLPEQMVCVGNPCRPVKPRVLNQKE